MNNEEVDSQLSAMFDDELPAAECELLARRLSRDEQLKARWGRYAVIGAAIRAERGVSLQSVLAGRVKTAISAEPALSESPAASRPQVAAGAWWQPLASVAVAAGVATVAILWMRSERMLDSASLNPAAPELTAAAAHGSSPSPSYVVPPKRIPNNELARLVVAHSFVSSPVAAHTMISALVAGDSGTTSAQPGSDELVPVDDVQNDATKSVE